MGDMALHGNGHGNGFLREPPTRSKFRQRAVSNMRDMHRMSGDMCVLYSACLASEPTCRLDLEHWGPQGL